MRFLFPSPLLLAAICLVLFPASLQAQGVIAGRTDDATGAGLPWGKYANYSTSVGDLDGDGFLDVVIGNLFRDPVAVFFNNADNPNNYLIVDLQGSGRPGGSDLFAVGAKIQAVVKDRTMTRWRTISSPGNTMYDIHFGLGLQDKVDTLTITWPSGNVTTLTDVAANQRLEVQEP